MSQIDSATLTAIRERLKHKQGQAYWQSLEELAATEDFKAFVASEFPHGVAPLEHTLDRRDFLKLLGASLALAGLTSCVRPVREREKIVPYVRAPEQIIPGKPLFFATSVTQGGYALGLLAESHQGRPTKVEGNPDHPASLGATDATTQATVLSLYDPERSQQILRNGQAQSWNDFSRAMSEALAQLPEGKGLYLLTETVTSPTLAQQLSELLARYPEAKWHQYDVLHSDAAFEGAMMAFGEPVNTFYDFTNADVVVSLDADFLGVGPAKLRYSKDFAKRRKVRVADDEMNRLYLLESTPSVTTALADHRLPLRPSQIEGVARYIAGELGATAAAPLPAGVDSRFVQTLIDDLRGHEGRSVVIAGDHQPPVVHALAHAINIRLGNVGTTVLYTDPVEARPVNQLESLGELVQDIASGEVELLIMIGGNPVYNAPADLKFAEALTQVPTSVHLSLYVDETSSRATWHIPQTHYLETWSDARAFEGTIGIMQPLIAPFYGGKSEHELLAALMGASDMTSYDIVRAYWQNRAEGDFDTFWHQSVYSGKIPGSHLRGRNLSFSGAIPAAQTTPQQLELTFRLDPSLQDGRYANNGWLQEIPKPITKITWDNAALVSPRTAERLNVATNDLITISANGESVSVPVWVQPGQADDTVTVFLGFGRTHAGRVGNDVGVNVYPLRTSQSPWIRYDAQITRGRGRRKLVSTQIHHQFDGTLERRHIVRHGTLAQFRAEPEHPHFAHPVAHHHSDLFPDYEYTNYAWGMVFDMTVCTGCNACVTACQAENNIPIVGKRQVEVGREMHWIRIDTYYGGDLDNPDFYVQPINCMHCEKAPCEPVCPVGATLHDDQGLNVMVYNRCVGTRYCSNNCPYKVRRFNFLQYAELTNTATELSLAHNPDVTVRSRGVMEKCSYCIQRIQQAYITSENEGRRIRDGEVLTACQAVCPTEAIVFGDINDEASQVAVTKTSPLNYTLLDELNTKPRTSYLAKVKNPNPALATESGVHS
jgi:molybdopterin-containing oxidoreductase family iron-sulfur binding subunit